MPYTRGSSEPWCGSWAGHMSDLLEAGDSKSIEHSQAAQWKVMQ